MRDTDDHQERDKRAFRYVAAVCGRVASDQPVAALDPADPAAIFAMVRRHRISTRAIAVLGIALRDRDPVLSERLTVRARDRGFAALGRTDRMVTISQRLAAANIRHLGVKGPVLAQQIYGDVGARDSKDLDLLVDPAAIGDAAAILGSIGFIETGTETGRGDTEADNKHRTFFGHGVEVEMHTRLLDVEALLPLSFEAVWARRETVMLGAVAVPALSMADTFLYLCAHGAQHLWFRLKWLEDIARIVTLPAYPEIAPQAIARARETGAEGIFISAIDLVDHVFGIAGTVPIADRRAGHGIVRLSLKALVAPAEHASAPPIGSILQKVPVQFTMARSWRYRRDLIKLLVLAPRTFDANGLPPGLGWLRLPLRPFMLLRDRLRRERS
ncbi:nucleotidyltransferase family protein [Sphingomonas aliaeris]|uniref:Nucleotidyltransferase family protein n=1 Tax=Sphingomonas aliaeris TaxID=2759526 RepID=A0A974S5A3_9SPHN|nr:nucleotidyltransferase family protein [Sphingomonas aliaeris]QQV78477.1 nucleotidyltransferase family protein [Sphingomonas aliaeris]